MERPFAIEDIEYFRRKLLDAKAAVLNRVKKTEDYGRETDSKEESMDPLDQASSTYAKEFLFSLSNSDRKLLQQIESALARIADGTYGICQHTGEPIERRRLEAVPWARLSVRAQELEEQGRL